MSRILIHTFIKQQLHGKFLNIALMKPQDFLADEIIVSKKLLQQADFAHKQICHVSIHHVNYSNGIQISQT